MRSIRVTINGVAHELHAYNCALFLFEEDKAHYNHLFIQTDEENGMYVFGHQDIFDKLFESRAICVHYLPYVPEPDQRAYEAYKAGKTNVYDQAIETTATEDTMTAEEVEYWAREFREDRIIDHWEELE